MTDTAPVNPVAALTAEATAEPHGFPWTWAGRTFRVKPQFDLRAVAALERGSFNRALVLLLGEAQTAELLSLDSDEPFTEATLQSLVEMVANAQGSTSGESGASTGS